MSVTLIATQILVIFGYVLVGFVAGKTGCIDCRQRSYLTKLCSTLILPFTILSAAGLDATPQQMEDFAIAAAVMFGMFTLGTLIVLGVCKLRGVAPAMRAVTTGLVVYPNATFLGLPLCTALFGEVAVLYSAAVILAFNLIFFTVQLSLYTNKKFCFRNLFSLPTLSTLLLIAMQLLHLRFPAPVQAVVSNIGAMVTPLSLMIIGVMVSESRLTDIFREKRAYGIMLLRNFALPLLVMLILRLTPMDSQARLCVLVYLSCPCATLNVIYSVQSNMEPRLCANTVLMSTLLFALSLPCVIALGQLVL